ncbi:MAG TPA: hypothetical protein VK136_10850 [Bacillota bacterium]|nr:hypothetical protein [Bacillota bacterium]
MRCGFLTYLVAFSLMALGVVLLLMNIGVVDLDFHKAWHYFYPLLFLIVGLKWLIDYFRNQGGSL